MDFTFWDIVRNLLTGLQWTAALSLVAFIGGGLIGLLVLLMRISKSRFARTLARGYIELFQGTPLLMVPIGVIAEVSEKREQRLKLTMDVTNDVERAGRQCLNQAHGACRIVGVG